MRKLYMYMWEFHVRKSTEPEFEKAYGPHGVWVNLFKEGEGYIKTELHKDINHEGRYITTDYWSSQEACEKFREECADEFTKIDEQCESLTLKEISLGSFIIIGQ